MTTDGPDRGAPREHERPALDPARSETLPSGEAVAPGPTDSTVDLGPRGLPATIAPVSEPAVPAGGALGSAPTGLATGEEPAPRRAALVGQTLAGRYTVLELLGEGGMSLVYLARHELLKKLVAVKVLREDIARSQSSLARFHREAMAAASIGDPHIVDVTDYGFTEQGDAFIVMERLEGQDLRRCLVVEGALAAGRAVAIARQILRALGVAHERGIIHRDLKAENVFLCRREERDFVKLLDFGISKILQPVEGAAAVTSTGTGVVLGTPQYIAPEQAHGAADLDHRVDIYSLGVILYEMLTGTLPFTGRTALEVVMKQVQEEPQPPRQRCPEREIPPALEAVVLRAMRKHPADRFATAAAMLAALPAPEALPGGFASGSLAPPPRPTRRWPFVVGAAVVLVIGLALLWYARRPTVPPSPIPSSPVPALAPLLPADAGLASAAVGRAPEDRGAGPADGSPAAPTVDALDATGELRLRGLLAPHGGERKIPGIKVQRKPERDPDPQGLRDNPYLPRKR